MNTYSRSIRHRNRCFNGGFFICQWLCWFVACVSL